MNREFQAKDSSYFPKLLKQVFSSPEFRFSEGDLWQRLEHVCYYQMGSLRYPAKYLLTHALQQFSQQFNVTVTVHDIKLQIVNMPVYKIACDGAIMAQDTNRIIGPIEEFFTDQFGQEQNIEDILEDLENFQPSEQGEILVSSPNWCKSSYLLEAVIYHFEQDQVSTEGLIRSTLRDCLRKSNKFKIASLAIETLGTEYNILSDQLFIEILHESLLELSGQLPYLKEIIITAQNKSHGRSLKKALAAVFNLQIP